MIGAYYEDPPLFSSDVRPAVGQSIRQSIGPIFAVMAKYLGDQWSIGAWDAMREGAIGFSTSQLDIHVGEDGREVQEESFRRHIALAKELGKALVIHDRDAHDAPIEAAKQRQNVLIERDRAGVVDVPETIFIEVRHLQPMLHPQKISGGLDTAPFELVQDLPSFLSEEDFIDALRRHPLAT